MRSGAISARATWEHRTGEPVSSSSLTEADDDSTGSDPPSNEPWPMLEGEPCWPTATASLPNDLEGPATWLERREHHASKEEGATRASLPLAIAAKLWPADLVREPGSPEVKPDALWPTATTRDAHASARHGYMINGHTGTTLNDAIREWLSLHGLSISSPGGPGSPKVYLSPSFVETLMGFPIGWSDLPRSETLSFLW